LAGEVISGREGDGVLARSDGKCRGCFSRGRTTGTESRIRRGAKKTLLVAEITGKKDWRKVAECIKEEQIRGGICCRAMRTADDSGWDVFLSEKEWKIAAATRAIRAKSLE